MTNKKILLCLAHMSGQEQHFIKEAFDSNWVVPLGPNVDGFEQDLKSFLASDKYVSVLSSGTAALHLAMVLAGVEAGDEVICQSFTFAASANPIVYQGALPVFVDSEPDTWNISPQLLKEAIEDRIKTTGHKPKAIVLVHLYGMPAKIDEIMEIANSYDIPVIEDAAEAMGSEYDGKKCGTFGKYGIFSFNGNKMITTSGGGALICPSAEAKKRATFYATQAREQFPFYQHERIGYNYRMSNICAGIGRGQMTIIDKHIEHHRHLADLYCRLFHNTPGVSVHINPAWKHSSNYWLTTITIDSDIAGTDNASVCQHLQSKGIESRFLWKPLHLQPVFKDSPRYVNGVSESLFNKGLCLPSGPCVSAEDVEMIAEEIKLCIRN